MTKEQCCGTCRGHRQDRDGEWVCENPLSAFYQDWTGYKDSCEDYEARD